MISSNAIINLTGVILYSLPNNWYWKIDGKTVILIRTQAPANEAKIAGIPNLNNTALSVLLPTRNILNRLFEKCTTPVNAIAISIGKKIAKTGVKIVPSPKPEKKVSIAVKNAARQIIIISILMLFRQK